VKFHITAVARLSTPAHIWLRSIDLWKRNPTRCHRPD